MTMWRVPSGNRFVVLAVGWAASTLLGVLLAFVLTMAVAGYTSHGVMPPAPPAVSSPPAIEAIPSQPLLPDD